MCYTVMHGSGHMFGPYFLNDGESFNGHTFLAMLSDRVFPDMMRVLGHAGFFTTTWQQMYFTSKI